MINTGVPTLTRQDVQTFVYRYTQTDTETLDLWFSAVVVFDENALDLISAATEAELEQLITKTIRYRQEIAREKELARLTKWNKGGQS